MNIQASLSSFTIIVEESHIHRALLGGYFYIVFDRSLYRLNLSLLFSNSSPTHGLKCMYEDSMLTHN